MKAFLQKFVILSAMLIGLPLAGVFLSGFPLSRYFEFPPKTVYVTHAPFSFPVFIVSLLSLAVFIFFFIKRAFVYLRVKKTTPEFTFPWWGWVGIIACISSWITAWTRFSFFEDIQTYTFVPLWLSFILIANALAYRQNGHCLMIDRPGIFLLLFPFSSVFWWFFEYLNRFVQNWHYTGISLNSFEYFLHATISFSTVLPAVQGVYEWIYGMPWIEKGFGNFVSIRFSRPRAVAWIVLAISGAGLTCIGVWPDYLFPLLWISPLLIVISLKTLFGDDHIIAGIIAGNWSPVISAAISALVCGWFWEMWNYYSLAKWKYTIPFVQGYHVFEMPVLGYAGYLPFGLECAVILEMIVGQRGQT
ncbi:MAG TPA: hypothetical protein PLQ82_00910 [Desulfobacteraceae bacterium]|nr:hypothetical protein [Desulfobacteraceae bacterium]HPQ27005.1 hypothetical protein [Desulfobacteraceae bacterium]